MSTIRPYTFDSIPRFSRKHLALRQSVETYLSSHPFDDHFKAAITATIKELLKTDLELSSPTLTRLGTDELKAGLNQVSHLVVLLAGSVEDRILVELDSDMIGLGLERILGGSGPGQRSPRALTTMEEGVLSFGVLKLLHHFEGSWTHSSQLPLRFDRFVSEPKDIDDDLLSAPAYYALTYRVGLDQRLMHLRVLLPESLIKESVFTTPEGGPSKESEHAHMKKLLSSLGARTVHARVEASQLNLSGADIATLEPGDIILIEDHQLALTPHGITGEVFIRIGTGENGGLRCQIINESGQSQLKVTTIVTQEKPGETSGMQGIFEPMTDLEPAEETEAETDLEENEDFEAAPPEEPSAPEEDEEEEAPSPSAPEEDNLAQTEGLLRDVPAPVVIELGRLQMNTAQVIRLKEGQILRLPRSTQDPVDLVVNDKVFARGELIEVDGELGVRLLHLTGG